MKYGVPQGSVLGPSLFSLFCNDFLDIAECEGILQMYVDDTTNDPMSSIVVCLYSSSPRYGSRLSCFALVSRFFTVCNDFSTSAFA